MLPLTTTAVNPVSPVHRTTAVQGTTVKMAPTGAEISTLATAIARRQSGHAAPPVNVTREPRHTVAMVTSSLGARKITVEIMPNTAVTLVNLNNDLINILKYL